MWFLPIQTLRLLLDLLVPLKEPKLPVGRSKGVNRIWAQVKKIKNKIKSMTKRRVGKGVITENSLG